MVAFELGSLFPPAVSNHQRKLPEIPGGFMCHRIQPPDAACTGSKPTDQKVEGAPPLAGTGAAVQG